MKVFNCSTNVIGGGVQNSVNFIKHLHKNNEINWFFIVSRPVWLEISSYIDDKYILVINKSPAKSLSARLIIKNKVKAINAKVVYTSAGPAYVNFSCAHVVGCSNPYVLGANKEALKLLGSVGRVKRYLHTLYQRSHIKKATYWLAQTELSKVNLANIGIDSSNITTVHNAISNEFSARFYEKNITYKDKPECFEVIIPSAYYPHKNLEFIIYLAKKINDIKFKFTLRDADFQYLNKLAIQEGVSEKISNIGQYKHCDAVNIYLNCDLVVLPSCLEVFSTSYIEAMASKKPLIVPMFDFTKDICGDYAYFYNYGDVESGVEQIKLAMNETREVKLEKYIIAKKLLDLYGTQHQRCNKILSIINHLE